VVNAAGDAADQQQVLHLVVWHAGVRAGDGRDSFATVEVHKLVHSIVGGELPLMPANASVAFQGLMQLCWTKDAASRPTAAELLMYFGAMMTCTGELGI